jgi:hypothetical protein
MSTQDLDLLTAMEQAEVFEALPTGKHLESNPLTPFSVQNPAAKPLTLPDQLQKRSSDFWSSIGHFLTLMMARLIRPRKSIPARC